MLSDGFNHALVDTAIFISFDAVTVVHGVADNVVLFFCPTGDFLLQSAFAAFLQTRLARRAAAPAGTCCCAWVICCTASLRCWSAIPDIGSTASAKSGVTIAKLVPPRCCIAQVAGRCSVPLLRGVLQSGLMQLQAC